MMEATDNKPLTDLFLKCVDCGEEYVFTVEDQRSYQDIERERRKRDPKAKMSTPKRCIVCRTKARVARMQNKERIEAIRKREAERIQQIGTEQFQRWRQDIRFGHQGNTMAVTATMTGQTASVTHQVG